MNQNQSNPILDRVKAVILTFPTVFQPLEVMIRLKEESHAEDVNLLAVMKALDTIVGEGTLYKDVDLPVQYSTKPFQY